MLDYEFLRLLKVPLADMCVCVLSCSVWDALTDNYISTWDGPASEGLNGNLSDQEVHVTPLFFISTMSYLTCKTINNE